jgi:hypothetical protein
LNLPIFLGGMSCNLCWHYLNLVVCTWANPGKIESNPDVASRHPLVVDFRLWIGELDMRRLYQVECPPWRDPRALNMPTLGVLKKPWIFD